MTKIHLMMCTYHPCFVIFRFTNFKDHKDYIIISLSCNFLYFLSPNARGSFLSRKREERKQNSPSRSSRHCSGSKNKRKLAFLQHKTQNCSICEMSTLPPVMYALPPIVSHTSPMDLPSTMYRLPTIQGGTQSNEAHTKHCEVRAFLKDQ